MDSPARSAASNAHHATSAALIVARSVGRASMWRSVSDRASNHAVVYVFPLRPCPGFQPRGSSPPVRMNQCRSSKTLSASWSAQRTSGAVPRTASRDVSRSANCVVAPALAETTWGVDAVIRLAFSTESLTARGLPCLPLGQQRLATPGGLPCPTLAHVPVLP